jgi:pimeloyl-ACP methyl ester carboxylesterase
MAPPPLYLLSGLGADERMFQFLDLHHPNPRVIKWITPDPEDTMATYARKLTQQMEPSQEPPIVIGLSFGGMVAQEIARQIPVKQLILISTLVDTNQIALHYRFWGWLKVQKWLPFALAKRFTGLGAWLFGVDSVEDKAIFRSIIQDTDVPTLRWSLTQILSWHNPAPTPEAVIIHGDRDKILPVPKVPHLHLIKGGEHLIVLNRAKELSELINRYLA